MDQFGSLSSPEVGALGWGGVLVDGPWFFLDCRRRAVYGALELQDYLAQMRNALV